ncbi:carbohydrate deacetylase [Clostridium hydrogeniformans]|uniref:carbohydrate deacetylase n=1 Tax=Clostridium hydrogeniformans TaxID=349933 RepID=UPI000489644D|nr:carbohydrate deacetylase [Clostridium hydrogeniformans]
MKVIFNGDDFGLTKGVSKGIIEAIKKGVLSDTTAMVNSPYFEDSIRYAKENDITSLGLHLTLTNRKPVLPPSLVKSLVDENGDFFKSVSKLPCNINIDEFEKEMRAQVNKFLGCGLELNHIDGHHHFFMFYPELLDIVIKLSKELNVPLRSGTTSIKLLCNKENIKTTDFTDSFYKDGATIENLISILNKHKDSNSILEFMMHPGYSDEELRSLSSYNDFREEELKILTSTRLKDYIKSNNIEIINFSQL